MKSPTLAESISFTQEQARLITEAGCDLLESGELDGAADIFKGLLVINPHDPFVHAAYGLVLKEQGDDSSAVREFNCAIEEDPKMPIALLNRGILKLKKGDRAGLDDLKAVSTLTSTIGERAREIVSSFASH